jgi:hypothetical protein
VNGAKRLENFHPENVKREIQKNPALRMGELSRTLGLAIQLDIASETI